MANGRGGSRGYLAGSGRDLRLGVPGRVRLEYRSGLLAARLSTIVKGTETGRVEEIRQSMDVGAISEFTYPNLGFW